MCQRPQSLFWRVRGGARGGWRTSKRNFRRDGRKGNLYLTKSLSENHLTSSRKWYFNLPQTLTLLCSLCPPLCDSVPSAVTLSWNITDTFFRVCVHFFLHSSQIWNKQARPTNSYSSWIHSNSFHRLRTGISPRALQDIWINWEIECVHLLKILSLLRGESFSNWPTGSV